jgi:hypothetical protein
VKIDVRRALNDRVDRKIADTRSQSILGVDAVRNDRRTRLGRHWRRDIVVQGGQLKINWLEFRWSIRGHRVRGWRYRGRGWLTRRRDT